ncbi:hypothetical protein CBC_A0930 [Clostridium botulinum C str. Eklund]|nr:hypothetical protein CBC_A0930 [Clostridium botulinum C str. Eklund]NEZ49318.1 hypothetical protein [Clostridium botulinum]
MNINKLDELLQESLKNFSLEAHSHVANKNPEEPLNEYDYDELARQTFYVMDDFRKSIVQYLKDINK